MRQKYSLYYFLTKKHTHTHKKKQQKTQQQQRKNRIHV
jgi:hypothetical protein